MKKHHVYLSILACVASLSLSVLFFIFQDFFKQTASLGLLGIFLINFVSSATLFVSGPAFLSVFSAGGVYPPILVALSAAVGSGGGEIISYIIGASGRDIAYEKLKKQKWFFLVEKYFQKFGAIFLFFFAIIPNPIFDSAGIFAGVFEYPLWKFLTVVMLARFVRYMVLAYVGFRVFT